MAKYSHFTLEDRQKLERLLREGKPKPEIADELDCALSTIYNQIKAGTVDGVYNADFAQEKYERFLKEKGRKSLFRRKFTALQLHCRLYIGEEI